jgi:hypothetical protein
VCIYVYVCVSVCLIEPVHVVACVTYCSHAVNDLYSFSEESTKCVCVCLHDACGVCVYVCVCVRVRVFGTI